MFTSLADLFQRWRNRATAALAVAVGVDELLLAIALALLSAGAWMVWPPSGLLAPALVLLWIVLPSRAPFIARPPAVKVDRRTE